MDITPVVSETVQIVQGYGNGGFRVAGTDYQGSVLIFGDQTHPWPVRDFTELTLGAFESLIAAASELDILLVGCGRTQQFIKPSLRDALRRQDLVVDAMDTGAACRTFNVLLSEERRVAAALIAI